MKLTIDITKQLNKKELRVKCSIDTEILGILGTSGSGKSMLLKCIAGIETPESGKIQLGERILFDKKRELIYLHKKEKLV